MKIGLDASCLLKNRTGVANYTLHLLNGLSRIDEKNEYFLWLNALKGDVPVEEYLENPLFRQIRTRLPGRALLRLWEYFRFPKVETLMRVNPDIFHSPNFFYQRVGSACKTATVHDLFFIKHPEYCEKYGGQYFSRVFEKRVDELDGIIAVSERTKSDLLNWRSLKNVKIQVIREAADPEVKAFADSLKPDDLRKIIDSYGLLDKRFVISVGTLEPRKNYGFMLSAYETWMKRIDNPPLLVIAGGRGWESDQLREIIRNKSLRNRVKLLGYVPVKHIAALYKNAEFFLTSSLYEGFGLPILEAMSLGTPVIVPDCSVFPETAGYAALFYESQNKEDLVDKMHEMTINEELRRKYALAGLKRSSEFCWRKTAEETIQFFENWQPN